MNICDQLLAGVGTLGLVVAEEDCDGIDGECPEEGVALEAPDRGRGGEVLQLLLVGHRALQPVILPLSLGHLKCGQLGGLKGENFRFTFIMQRKQVSLLGWLDLFHLQEMLCRQAERAAEPRCGEQEEKGDTW